MKSTDNMEKYYVKSTNVFADAFKKAGTYALKAMADIGTKVGLLVFSFTRLGFTVKAALNITKYIVAFDLLARTIGQSTLIVRHISLGLKQGYEWVKKLVGGAKALPEPMTKVQKEMKKINTALKEVNKGYKLWNIAGILRHPIEAIKALKENMKEGAGTISIMEKQTKSLLQTRLDALSAEVEIKKFLDEELLTLEQIGELESVRYKIPKILEYLKKQSSGIIMYDISGIMVLAYKKIYAAAKWAFGGILDITTSVFQKIFNMSIWVKTGIITAFVGMYYKITDAAMDAEDALSWDKLGPTRTILERLSTAIKGILAALGKPFLSGIRAVSDAIAKWLEEATPGIAKWADKWVNKLAWIQRGFIAWVAFLSTDFKGGVSVALKVVSELFKGFADALVILMDFAGRRAGKALVEGFRGIITGLIPSLVEEANKSLKWLGQKLMKSSEDAARNMERLTGLGGGGAQRDPRMPPGMRLGPRGATEAESVSAAILRVYRERAENIKKILEGMPTWGDVQTKDIDTDTAAVVQKVKQAADSMAAHRIKMMEQGVTLSEMQWRLDTERIKIQEGWATKSSASIDRTLKSLDVELEMIGKTKEARERALDVMRFEAQLAETLGEESIRSFEAQERYNELMGEYITKLDVVAAKEREINEERDKSLRGWAAVSDSVVTWMKSAANWGKNLGDILTNAFDRAADSFASMLMKQKVDWKAFGAMFIQELLAMIMKLYIAVALKTALGFISPTPAPVGTTFANPMAVFGAPSAQHGGEITQTGLAKVHKGEVFSGINNEKGFGGITVNNYAGDSIDVEVMDEERVINISRRTSLQSAQTDGAYRRAHNIRSI